jgi:hypothetical protein
VISGLPLSTRRRNRHTPSRKVASAGFGRGGTWRHGASWKRVLLSVATVRVHDASNVHGAEQETTRQMIGPTHATAWLHCP